MSKEILTICKNLSSISPTFADNENFAAEFIRSYLDAKRAHYYVQRFDTRVPKTQSVKLYVNGRQFNCLGATLKTGEIKSNEYVISSLGYYPRNAPFVISFNPLSESISVAEFYEVPAVAVSRKDIADIILAREVRGFVKVEPINFRSKNILVGNRKNLKIIASAHYDSIISDGALDNAGSVSVLLYLVTEFPELLNNMLIVFSGNEEVSYDAFDKSGYGFRVFESKYKHLLHRSSRIVVVDGVGATPPKIFRENLDWVLQLKTLDEIKEKVYWISSEQIIALQYFHSDLDTVEIIEEEYLENAIALIKSLIEF